METQAQEVLIAEAAQGNALVTAQAPTAGFDLDSLDSLADVTFRLPLVFNADGTPKAGLILCGKNSDQCMEALQKIRIHGIMRSHSRESDLDATTEEGATELLQGIQSNDRTLALGITVGWWGFERKGVPVDFDRSVVNTMFIKSPQWQTKVLAALEVEANFLPA